MTDSTDSHRGPERPVYGKNSQPATLVELLHHRADRQGGRRAFTFLVDGERDETALTYGELDRQARTIAAFLHGQDAAGERALLLYPPGLEYIAAFFGCLYAGVIAVPVYPPDPLRLERTVPRLQGVAADAGATLVLTTSALRSISEPLREERPDLAAMRWLATDEIPAGGEVGWEGPEISADDLAFLQYTSGSTQQPRGVMLSHRNLMRNLAMITVAFEVTEESVGVIWLPPYHDMGLIGGLLEPIYGGFPCILMSPLAFLQRPLRWLEAMARYGGTISGGPNFAYDLCVRKSTAAQRAGLSLSSWQIAFNGAEPVRPETLARFQDAFAPSGFRPEAFYPCYGLAEATLFVSGGRVSEAPRIETVEQAVLEGVPDPATLPVEGRRVLVSCGPAANGQKILVVDPERGTRRSPGEEGEIWVAGPNVALGYWNRPDESEECFGAVVTDTGEGPFLRTGDLGFMRDGELFITGRRKDMILIRGRNLYPQEIEWTVEGSHATLRAGSGAAFAVETAGEERLVVVQEVNEYRPGQGEQIMAAIRRAVTAVHNVAVYAVVLIAPRTIPKTSSGKIQRAACRQAFLAGSLEIMAQSVLNVDHGPRAPLLANEGDLLRKALFALPAEKRSALLLSHLQERLAQTVGGPIDPAQPLDSVGLDSVTLVELSRALEAELGVIVPVAELAPGHTVRDLAAQLLALMTVPAPD